MPNVWEIGIKRCYSSYTEIKSRRVVAQGWPSTGDLSDLFGQQENVVTIDPRINGLGGEGPRTLRNLLCRIHFRDLVIACEGNSVMGICEIGPSLIYGYDHSGSFSRVNPRLFGEGYFEYANGLFFVNWIDWNDFMVVTRREPPSVSRVRGIVYCRKDPQGILDAWSKYKKSITNLECCFGDGQSPSQKQDLMSKTNHPECLHHSSIKKSNLEPHFVFPDIQARITLIPRSILATLTFDPSRLSRALIELQVLYDGIAGDPHLGEAYRRGMDEINALQSNLYLGDRINPDTLNSIQGWIKELFIMLSRNAEERVDSPPIVVDFDGVFLPRQRVLENHAFPPGCYVADDLEGDRLAEVENHELTHAYIYTHKKLDFKCPYIDEGLAEYGGKITTRPPGTLIENWKVSRFRYYNFLDYVISQSPAAIQELASDWILGTRLPDYWCRITASYRPR